MPSLKSLLPVLPDNYSLTLADVGSAGGLKDRWKPVASRVNALLFEPREAGGAAQHSGRNRIFPVALGATPGSAALNITAMANMSSMLQPNTSLLGRFRKKGAHAVVTAQQAVAVDTLDLLLEREQLQVDALKVDTQGSEFEILQGSMQALQRSVVLAEVEISFVERYQGQATAATLIGWMQAHGFQLIEIYRMKRYRHLNTLGVGNAGTGGGHRAGQLAYADAVFMVSEELFARRIAQLPRVEAGRQLLGLLVALLVYGKVDTAAAWFDQHQELLDTQLAIALRGWLGRWRKAEYGRGGLHLVLDFLARKV
ncbi:MAG: FkbM family methyltransferase [Steroidobacteraceae bacterium]